MVTGRKNNPYFHIIRYDNRLTDETNLWKNEEKFIPLSTNREISPTHGRILINTIKLIKPRSHIKRRFPIHKEKFNLTL